VTSPQAKWHRLVALLQIVEETLRDEAFAGYVDTSTVAEDLELMLESARWNGFQLVGTEEPGTSRRIVNGTPLTFDQYWNLPVTDRDTPDRGCTHPAPCPAERCLFHR
jgi:hypothetical protein